MIDLYRYCSYAYKYTICSPSGDNGFGYDISEMQISVLMFTNKQHPVSNVLFTLQKGEM